MLCLRSKQRKRGNAYDQRLYAAWAIENTCTEGEHAMITEVGGKSEEPKLKRVPVKEA